MMNNINNTNELDNTAKRGFASMPHEKVEVIARRGGHASAESKHKKLAGK